MTEIRWTLQAVEDLTAIKEFIGRDSPAHALGVVERLYASIDQLRQFPESGRVLPERPKFRELVRTPYRIVYRYVDEVVQILTVFHATRPFSGSS